MPWLILFGLVVVFLILFGERLLPAREVKVTTVVTEEGRGGEGRAAPAFKEASPHEGEALFQASGWIEADPFPVRATALLSGVVEHVHVLGGDAVRTGDPIATLVREDAEIALAAAKAAREAAENEQAVEEAERDILEAREAVLESRIRAAESRLTELADLAERAERVGMGNLSEREIVQARLKEATQRMEVEALTASLVELEAERLQQARREALRRARVREAEAREAQRLLDLERTVVRAPVDGVVQRLLVAPGDKKTLLGDNPESATVALLFNPEALQARVDVPLELAAQLEIGQAARVRTEFLPDRQFRGWVERIVGEADLQRNTLQVKISLEEPDPRLRPEILCRAEFLVGRIPLPGADVENRITKNDAPALDRTDRVRLFAPENALFRESGEWACWVIDASGGRLELRRVTPGREAREGWIEVTEGLRPGDRLVLNPEREFKPGERVEWKFEP